MFRKPSFYPLNYGALSKASGAPAIGVRHKDRKIFPVLETESHTDREYVGMEAVVAREDLLELSARVAVDGVGARSFGVGRRDVAVGQVCLLYTSDAADD